MFNKIITLGALVASVTATANVLTCEVKMKNLNTKNTIEVEQNTGVPAINLGNDKTLSILFFGDDIRFSELRKPTEEESKKFKKENGREEIGLMGMTVAYSQTTANEGGTIQRATLFTEDVAVSCKQKE